MGTAHGRLVVLVVLATFATPSVASPILDTVAREVMATEWAEYIARLGSQSPIIEKVVETTVRTR